MRGTRKTYLILEAHELDYRFGDPRPDDFQLYLPHVDLGNERVSVMMNCDDGRRTFLSNSGGNFMVLRSLSSLSENRRSWSAEVPLKNPVMNEAVAQTRSAMCTC
jgi:hypothetical protein